MVICAVRRLSSAKVMAGYTTITRTMAIILLSSYLAKILTYYMQALYLLQSCGRVGVRIHRLDMCYEPARFFPAIYFTVSAWYIDVDTYVHLSTQQMQLLCDMLNWPRIIWKGFLDPTIRIHCNNTHTLFLKHTRERRNLIPELWLTPKSKLHYSFNGSIRLATKFKWIEPN